MTKNTKLKAASVLLSALFFVGYATSPVSAEFTVTGAAADITAFGTLLTELVKGATVTIDPTNKVIVEGTPTNAFGTHLKEVTTAVDAQGRPIVVSIKVGRNQVDTWIDAFKGGGVQVIDLDDIAKFPSPNQMLPTKGAMLIHGIKEVFGAVKAGKPNNHTDAHKEFANPAEDAVNMEEAGIRRITEWKTVGSFETQLRPGESLAYRKTATFQKGDAKIEVEVSLKKTITQREHGPVEVTDVKQVPTRGGGKRRVTEKDPGLRSFDDEFQPIDFHPFDQPGYLELDLLGNILISEERLNKVLVLDDDLNLRFEIEHPELQNPQGIAVSPLGDLILVGSGNNILAFDLEGAFQYLFTDPGLSDVRDLALDREANLFVSSFGNDSILKFDPFTGTLLDTLTTPLVDGPEGLAVDQLGNIWVSSFLNNQILRFDSLTNEFSLFASGGLLDGPKGLALSPQSFVEEGVEPGNLSAWHTTLLVASFNNNLVLEFDLETGQLLNFAFAKTPTGIAQRELEPIPEPSTLTLLATGALGLLGYGWRRRKRTRPSLA